MPEQMRDQMPEPVDSAAPTPVHSEQKLAEMLAKCVAAFGLSLPPEFEGMAFQEMVLDTLIPDAPTPGTPTLGTPVPYAPIPGTSIPFGLADLDELDLTQYSEERFTPGISSDGGPLGR
jgi:hypothetical protein